MTASLRWMHIQHGFDLLEILLATFSHGLAWMFINAVLQPPVNSFLFLFFTFRKAEIALD